MSVVFTVALTLLVSYLLGCFNGSVMTSHFIIRDDVRQHGSGNAGLTNFYRTYGARYALCVIVCDMGKTVLACLIGGYLMHWVVGEVDALTRRGCAPLPLGIGADQKAGEPDDRRHEFEGVEHFGSFGSSLNPSL